MSRIHDERTEAMNRLLEHIQHVRKSLKEILLSGKIAYDMEAMSNSHHIIMQYGKPAIPKALQDLHRDGLYGTILRETGELEEDYWIHLKQVGAELEQFKNSATREQLEECLTRAERKLGWCVQALADFQDHEKALLKQTGRAA